MLPRGSSELLSPFKSKKRDDPALGVVDFTGHDGSDIGAAAPTRPLQSPSATAISSRLRSLQPRPGAPAPSDASISAAAQSARVPSYALTHPHVQSQLNTVASVSASSLPSASAMVASAVAAAAAAERAPQLTRHGMTASPLAWQPPPPTAPSVAAAAAAAGAVPAHGTAASASAALAGPGEPAAMLPGISPAAVARSTRPHLVGPGTVGALAASAIFGTRVPPPPPPAASPGMPNPLASPLVLPAGGTEALAASIAAAATAAFSPRTPRTARNGLTAGQLRLQQALERAGPPKGERVGRAAADPMQGVLSEVLTGTLVPPAHPPPPVPAERGALAVGAARVADAEQRDDSAAGSGRRGGGSGADDRGSAAAGGGGGGGGAAASRAVQAGAGAAPAFSPSLRSDTLTPASPDTKSGLVVYADGTRPGAASLASELQAQRRSRALNSYMQRAVSNESPAVGESPRVGFALSARSASASAGFVAAAASAPSPASGSSLGATGVGGSPRRAFSLQARSPAAGGAPPPPPPPPPPPTPGRTDGALSSPAVPSSSTAVTVPVDLSDPREAARWAALQKLEADYERKEIRSLAVLTGGGSSRVARRSFRQLQSDVRKQARDVVDRSRGLSPEPSPSP